MLFSGKILTYLIQVLSASKSDKKSIAITEKDQEEIMKMSRDPDVLGFSPSVTVYPEHSW